MKTLDMALLYMDNVSTSRAYLNVLLKNEYIPRRIIDIEVYPEIKKLSFLPGKLNRSFSKRISDYYTSRNNKKLLQYRGAMIEEGEEYLFRSNDLRHCCIEYQKIRLQKDINDEKLNKLLKDDVNCYLYTGGGIVRNELLLSKNLLHIHPGIIPFVKGSDGLLWSILKRGKIGMSCFFMNSRIDEGRLIASKEYEIRKIKLQPEISDLEYDTIYEALLVYYDPVYRADLLADIIKKHEDLNFSFTSDLPQGEGSYFKRMEVSLRNQVIRSILNETT